MRRTEAYTGIMNSQKTHTLPPDANVVIDAARAHPPISGIISLQAAQLVRDRKMLRDQIDQLDSEKGSLVEKFLAAEQKAKAAIAEVKAAEKALQAARAKATQANMDQTAASLAIHRARENAANALKVTAENAIIDTFRTEMFDEMAKARRGVSFAERVEHNRVTGKVSSRYVESNGPQITGRLLAISEALIEAEELRLLPDQTVVPARIAEIKAALPKVGGIIYSGEAENA
jgi:hypothetical protein